MVEPGAALRRILHVDMDAFYASVEQRDRPELRGRPVVVGGDPKSRSVVCAASYEARRFGIRSAMSCSRAARLCPEAVFLPPDFSRYKEVSRTLRALFAEVSDLVEPLSLDEAFLDVTENRLGFELGVTAARWIKAEIVRRTGLTASAGVGPSKLVAKIASERRKPDGLTVVHPSKVQEFLDPLPVACLWGVGTVTGRHLGELGVRTVADLRRLSRLQLQRELGKFGGFLFDLARGIDDRAVVSEWVPKSRGSERTFERDTTELPFLYAVLVEEAEEVAAALRRRGMVGRTVTIKLKYHDFTLQTRSGTTLVPTNRAESLYQCARAVLDRTLLAPFPPVRLLGLSVTNLSDVGAPGQLCFDF